MGYKDFVVFWFKDLRFWSFERFGGFWVRIFEVLGIFRFLEFWGDIGVLDLWRFGVLRFLDLCFEVFCWFRVLFWGFRLLGLGVFGFLGFLY